MDALELKQLSEEREDDKAVQNLHLKVLSLKPCRHTGLRAISTKDTKIGWYRVDTHPGGGRGRMDARVFVSCQNVCACTHTPVQGFVPAACTPRNRSLAAAIKIKSERISR